MTEMTGMEERYRDLLRLYTNGFFDDVRDFEEIFFAKDGKFELEKLYKLWQMFDFGKYTLKYYLVHRKMMPTFGRPKKYESAEEREKLYRECLDQNVTWQEKLDCKPVTDDVIL